MSEIDELKKRLDTLERENSRLRGAAKKPQETTTVVGTWKGHPILRFEGPFRPFSIGLKKASLILQKIEDVKFFVEHNKHKMGVSSEDEEPDGTSR
jgi:hypothetical protein